MTKVAFYKLGALGWACYEDDFKEKQSRLQTLSDENIIEVDKKIAKGLFKLQRDNKNAFFSIVKEVFDKPFFGSEDLTKAVLAAIDWSKKAIAENLQTTKVKPNTIESAQPAWSPA